MAVATSYNVTSVQGARENLENLLRVVEPQTTPLYATLKQGAAPKAVLNEWLTDTLSDPEIGGVEDALGEFSDLHGPRPQRAPSQLTADGGSVRGARIGVSGCS